MEVYSQIDKKKIPMNTKIIIPIALCILIVLAVLNVMPAVIGFTSSLIGLVVGLLLSLLLLWAIYRLFKWSLRK